MVNVAWAEIQSYGNMVVHQRGFETLQRIQSRLINQVLSLRPQYMAQPTPYILQNLHATEEVVRHLDYLMNLISMFAFFPDNSLWEFPLVQDIPQC